jgi:plasmid stability protein
MAHLLVRGVDGGIDQVLKKRAGAHGRSAGAGHRAILAAAMMIPRRSHLVELVGSMADVGLDSDFES